MGAWSEKWARNGWLTNKKRPVKNRALIEEALRLRRILVSMRSEIHITHISRIDNDEADSLANQGCWMDLESESVLSPAVNLYYVC